MTITDLPLLRAFKEKLRYHHHRQRVLAENVANATTPGFTGRDIAQPDFFRIAAEGSPRPAVRPLRTDVKHLSGAAPTTSAPFKEDKVTGYEVTPDGNGVVLEEQMMKIAENHIEYQTVASLYQRGLGLLKTAVGRR